MKKKNALFEILVLAFIAVSCSKNVPLTKEEEAENGNIESNTNQRVKPPKNGANGNSSGQRLPASTVTPITVATTAPFTGQYISSYGMGITFGTNLPHPITSDPQGLHDGEPIPTITYVSWTLNANYPVYTVIKGAFFDILEPTFPAPSSVRQQITNYQTSLNNYFKDTTGTVAYPPPMGTSSGSENGFIEVRGMVIRDHTSPTKMSACSDQYKPPPHLID